MKTLIKIYPDRNVEEAIYYTLRAHNFYLQVAFPENTQYYGNVLIYQINVRENHEVWISNLCAQNSQPIQTITPLLILSLPTALNAQYTQDPNYQKTPTTLAFARNNTVASYNNTSQQKTTQLNLQSYSQITQHNIRQNRILPRNNNSLINNHFTTNNRHQNNPPGTPDRGT